MTHKTTDDPPFIRWQREAAEWAQALRSAQLLGNVVLAPMVAERIAAMLLQAEPPGSAAYNIAQGYKAGRERLGVEVSNG